MGNSESIPGPGPQPPLVTPRWYVTSPFFRREPRGWDVDTQPCGALHAKEAGSHLTACGIDSTSWQKFFHLGFSSAGDDRCERCSEALDGGA
jgi:hypothetical protein